MSNSAQALFVVICARLSRDSPRSPVKNSATVLICFGSLILPRNGTGVKNGASVSRSKLAAGTVLYISSCSACFANVAIPLTPMYSPRFTACCILSAESVKLCNTPLIKPAGKLSKIGQKSSKASRTWKITGKPVLTASSS